MCVYICEWKLNQLKVEMYIKEKKKNRSLHWKCKTVRWFLWNLLLNCSVSSVPVTVSNCWILNYPPHGNLWSFMNKMKWVLWVNLIPQRVWTICSTSCYVINILSRSWQTLRTKEEENFVSNSILLTEKWLMRYENIDTDSHMVTTFLTAWISKAIS